MTPNVSPIQLCNIWDLFPYGLSAVKQQIQSLQSEHTGCGWQQFTVWSAFSRSKLTISIQGIGWNGLQKDKIIAELSRKQNYYRDSEAYARSYFVQLHCKSTHHPTKITDCTILFLGWDFQMPSSWPKHAPRLLLATFTAEKLTRLW